MSGILLVCLAVLTGSAGAVEDPAAAEQQLSIGDATVNEGAGTATFTVSLTAGKDAADVDVKTSSGTASPGSDYAEKSERLTGIPAGGNKTFIVAIAQDALDEDDETFKVTLSNPAKATIGDGEAIGKPTIGDGEAIGKIIDDDSAPTVASISDVTVSEGVKANFTVQLSAASGKAVTVKYSTAEGTATDPEDFAEVLNGSIQIAAGQTSGTIGIDVKQDTLVEGTEHFFVNLVGADNASIGSDPQGRATITDDDTAPSTSGITDPIVNEGNSGVVKANFVVTLSAASSQPVTIRYSTVDGSAKQPADYVPADNQAITIAAGQTSGTIAIDVKGDTDSEGSGDPRSEDFFVNLLSATNATLGSDTQGKATIVDDDVVPTRRVSVFPAEVTEGSGEGSGGNVNLDFKVRLDASSAVPVAVTATTENGTAVAPGDYDVKTERITFAPGVVERTFSVSVKGDTLDEPDETVLVRLTDASPAPPAAIATAQAVGTIKDNDNNSKLAIGDTEANEGSAGASSTMTFKVTLAPASARTVTVAYATASGTATVDTDYKAASGTLSFAPGETEKVVSVTVLGDDVSEENETVLLNLSAPVGAALADGQGQGVIVDKNAPPSLSINDVTAREGEGATFTVTLAGTTLRPVTVTFSTSDGTAKEGSDYAPRRGTLTFAPGEKTKTIAVTVLDDTVEETAESFGVSLGDPVNAVILKRSGNATIEASDLSTVANPTGGGGLNQGGTGGLNNPNRPLPPLNPKPPAGKTASKVLLPRIILGPRIVTLRSGQARML
ncbi:MAG: hypothetical protein H0U07_05210, partial [Actinobacteria bacterium]|nr:hypothetical protein [Actinomycetota bacterium]